MTVTIKPLTERDFFSWYALFTEYAGQAGLAPDDEQAMRVWTTLQTADSHGVIAADQNGGTVGLVHFRVFDRLLEGDSGYVIEDLYVTEGARRSGVATALVEHVRTRGEDEHRPLLRWVAREDDPAAQALQAKFAESAGGWMLHDISVG
jgi:GNAT superfamily N-acetyltransferase